MKNTDTHVLEEVVKQNEGRWGHISGCTIKCYGISCSTCPMHSNKHITLEMIRDELTSRTSGGCLKETRRNSDMSHYCPECQEFGSDCTCTSTPYHERGNNSMTTHSFLCDYERSAGKKPCTCKKPKAISGNNAEAILTDGIEGVSKPSHYALFDNIEAIEIIARSMTVEMFRGYCLGNIMKYRLRAGKKSELAYAEKDLAKANFYAELFEKHKELCYDYR